MYKKVCGGLGNVCVRTEKVCVRTEKMCVGGENVCEEIISCFTGLQNRCRDI